MYKISRFSGTSSENGTEHFRETQFGSTSRALLPQQTSLHGIALRGGTAFTLSLGKIGQNIQQKVHYDK